MIKDGSLGVLSYDDQKEVEQYQRFVAWLKDPYRKDPDLAFEKGPFRLAAWAVHSCGLLNGRGDD